MDTPHSILCLSSSFWGLRKGSREHLMSRLAHERTVLYVDYQCDPLQVVRYPHVRAFAGVTARLIKISDSLFVMRPRMQLPPWIPGARAVNERLLRAQIRKAMDTLRIHSPLLWVYHPRYARLCSSLPHRGVLYHCIDDYPAELKRTARDRLAAEEQQLCRQADIVIAQNQKLYDKLKPHSRRISLMEPGVDDDLFQAGARARAIPKPGTCIGLIGSFDHRLNYRLVRELAERMPQAHFLLAGPLMSRAPELRRLLTLPHVEYLGSLEKGLPQVYGRCSGGIIPYHVTEFTNGIAPLKAYEFFSFGVPVVATPFAAARDLAAQGLLYVAQEADFVENSVRVFSGQEDPALAQARIRFAGERLWSQKAAHIRGILADLHL